MDYEFHEVLLSFKTSVCNMAANATFQHFEPSTEKFSSWQCRLENYLRFEKKTTEADKQCAILAFMGPVAFKRFFDKVPSDKRPDTLTYEEISEVLRKIYEPGENIWSVRLSFRTIRQKSNEPLEDFEARLRTAGRICKWIGNELQMNLIEQFVGGLHDQTVQQAIMVKCAAAKDFSEVFLKTEELVNAKKSASTFRNAQGHLPGTDSVNKVHVGGKGSFGKRSSKRTSFSASKSHTSTRKCYRCGNESHLAPDCKFKDTECSSCKTKGHLSSVCRKTQNHHLLQEVPFNFVDDNGKSPIELTVRIHDREVRMELDTGSGISTMEYAVFREMFPDHLLHENDVKLRTATQEHFEPEGYATVSVSYQNIQKNLKLYLVDRPGFPTLFGRSWLKQIKVNPFESEQCHSIGLNYRDEAKKLLLKYPKLSKDGIGKIPNIGASLHVKENPTPAYARPRPVPHALLPLVERELDHLEKFDVIEKVNASEWAHPVVIALRGKGDTSNKRARICGDFKIGLNRFLTIDDHPLKNIRHALDNIGVGKRFTVLDISNAFLHMPIREEDRKYVTVNTHRGLYRFKRMCNGLASAPAIWQRFMEGILAGIEGLEVIIDDIIITAPTDEDYLRRLDVVLERLSSNDIRLNLSKCEFFAEEVKFCGFRLRHQEIHKCDDKISSFKNAPTPKTVTELKSFMGMIQFYSSFAPQLTDLAHPLYQAFRGEKNGDFNWTPEMDRAFIAVKAEMCSPRVLVPFNPKKPLLLATDASSYAVSAVLSNRYEDSSERPIAYYSRTLTDTEKRYTQLEKEALGIKEGISRFFYYLFGRRFTLITDSKPLVSILSPTKALPPLSAMRMTNYSMFLQSFNYDIIYRNTNDHGNADMLSRLPTRSEDFVVPQETNEILLIEIYNEVPLDIKEIARKTLDCEDLRPLLEWLQGSRAKPRGRREGDLSEYTVLNGAIFRGHRVAIPIEYRPYVLKILHEAHMGADKMKELARRYVWWSSLNSDIEREARSCIICAEHGRQPPRTYHPWEPAERPLDRIHIDYAGPIDGKYLLLIVDANTKWLEVFSSKTKTSRTTLKHLREFIARFGLPRVLVSDNDPCFASDEFNTFCRSNGITHRTSPPFHPASNGQVERYVQTVKQGLKKIKADGEKDLHTALQQFLFRHRMVHNSTTSMTPAQAMLGRQLRSRLDLLTEQPGASYPPPPDSKFKIGDGVMARLYNGRQKWMPGKVVKLCGKKVALIESSSGTHKRHFNQIRKCEEIQRKQAKETSSEVVQAQLHPALLFDESLDESQSPIVSVSDNNDQVGQSSSGNDSMELFDDAQEEMDPLIETLEEDRVPEPNEPEVPVEEIPRRSARATAGKPPIRFQEMNL